MNIALEEASTELRIVEGVQWRNSVDEALLSAPDLVLFLGESGAVIIELMLGKNHFARPVYEMAGRLLAFRNLNVDPVVLCETRRTTEGKLRPQLAEARIQNNDS
jgi:hypothetical protein